VLLAAAAVALLAREGHGQAPAKPPAPAWEGQATTDWGPAAGPPPWAVPPQGPVPNEDGNGTLLRGDPLLDRPPYAPPGWFAAVDVNPVWAHIKNKLAAPVTVGPLTDEVRLPTAALDVTVSPRFEFGYRMAQGAGALLASYRFVETEGSGTVSPFGPAGDAAALRSRLDLNVLDLDYGSREFSLGPRWDMKWLAGVRLASLYFDSQAADATARQRETNHFAGAGPHVGLELWHCLDETGLALFARLDSELLVGRIRQSFTEALAGAAGETDQSQVQGAPVLSAQAGLGWTPPGSEHLRLAAGYTWERWWDVGFVGGPGGSHAEVTVQGLFLRGEWRY
jgi:hypothetical protein